MAPKSKTVKKQAQSTLFSDLPIRDPDLKYTGYEPVFSVQPEVNQRTGLLTKAFTWYSRYVDRKTAKEQIALYLENFCSGDPSRSSQAKLVRKVEDNQIVPTLGWLARLAGRGLVLTDSEHSRLLTEVDRLISSLDVVSKKASKETSTVRPNVQEIMRERAREAAGELEGLLDDFILAGAKPVAVNPNVVGVLTERNVLPAHIHLLIDPWKQKLEEFNAVQSGKPPQVVEAYSNFSKVQVKGLIKFCEAVIAGLGSYINVKKASKAPRKRKVVSPEKQAAGIKFQKQIEEFKLTSVHPSKIVGSSEVWAYDSAKRKLHYYVADPHVGSLGVKGTTILGFDQAKSGIKTLRKPGEIIKKLMAAGKPASRKVFADIAAVHAQPNGRTNENLLFLKVY